MDRTDLAFAGVVRQAELVRSGEVSSRELVELYLERIERLQPRLNCFTNVMSERALAEADQADARRAASDERPLLGVPIAVKDVQDVAGEVTANGSAAFRDEPKQADSAIVAKLRGAGAVIIGKTTTPELAIIGDTASAAYGVTRNPWNPDRSPGGSSGGSAAAVAAGLCAAATASDGAGSIRYPAAHCGLFGLKPQRERVPMGPYEDHWNGLSVSGFETRDVADTALLLDVASQFPPERPFAEAARTPPGRMSVAVSTRAPFPTPVSKELRRAVDETAELLRSLGHSVERADPSYGTASNAMTMRYLRGIADDVRAVPDPERLQRQTRGFGRLGSLVSDGQLRRLRKREGRYRDRINRIFAGHDVVLTPMTAKPPPKAARWKGRPALLTLLDLASTYPFGVVWNMIGQPAAAVPAGTSSDGLPIAVQLAGRQNDEAALISLAAQLEAERRWPEHRPPLAV